MEMKVQVRIKSVYGNELIYPFNAQADAFAAIAGTKTLSRQNLALIKGLGYEIEVIQDQVKL